MSLRTIVGCDSRHLARQNRCYRGSTGAPPLIGATCLVGVNHTGVLTHVRTRVLADVAGRIPLHDTPRALFVVASAPRERALFRVVDLATPTVERRERARPSQYAATPIRRAGRGLIVTAALATLALFASVASFAAWTTYSAQAPSPTLKRPTGIGAAAAAPKSRSPWTLRGIRRSGQDRTPPTSSPGTAAKAP